jgi:hypothetical protein
MRMLMMPCLPATYGYQFPLDEFVRPSVIGSPIRSRSVQWPLVVAKTIARAMPGIYLLHVEATAAETGLYRSTNCRCFVNTPRSDFEASSWSAWSSR